MKFVFLALLICFSAKIAGTRIPYEQQSLYDSDISLGLSSGLTSDEISVLTSDETSALTMDETSASDGGSDDSEWIPSYKSRRNYANRPDDEPSFMDVDSPQTPQNKNEDGRSFFHWTRLRKALLEQDDTGDDVEEPVFNDTKAQRQIGQLLKGNHDIFTQIMNNLDIETAKSLKQVSKATYRNYYDNQQYFKQKLNNLWRNSPLRLWEHDLKYKAHWRKLRQPTSHSLAVIHRLSSSRLAHLRDPVNYVRLFECASQPVKNVEVLNPAANITEPTIKSLNTGSATAKVSDTVDEERRLQMLLETHRQRLSRHGIALTFRVALKNWKPELVSKPSSSFALASNKPNFENSASLISRVLQHCEVISKAKILSYKTSSLGSISVYLDNKGYINFEIVPDRGGDPRVASCKIEKDAIDDSGYLPLAVLIDNIGIKVYGGKDIFPFPQTEPTLNYSHIRDVYLNIDKLSQRAQNSQIPGFLYVHRFGTPLFQSNTYMDEKLSIGNDLDSELTVSALNKWHPGASNICTTKMLIKAYNELPRLGELSATAFSLPEIFVPLPLSIPKTVEYSSINSIISSKIIKPQVRDVFVYDLYKDSPRETADIFYGRAIHQLNPQWQSELNALPRSLRLKLRYNVDLYNIEKCLS